MVETLVPIAKGLLELVGVLSIGLIIAVAFLDKDIKGSIKSSELTKKIKKYYIFWLYLCSHLFELFLMLRLL